MLGIGLATLIRVCFWFTSAVKLAMASSRALPEISISDAKLPSGRLVKLAATSMPSCPKSFRRVPPDAIKLLPLPGASESDDSLPASAASRPWT